MSQMKRLKHRRKEKNSTGGKTLAERIVSQRKNAAKEAEFFPASTKDNNTMDLCYNTWQFSVRDEDEIEYWDDYLDDSDPSKSIDSSYLTEEPAMDTLSQNSEPTPYGNNTSFRTDPSIRNRNNVEISDTFSRRASFPSYDKPLEPMYSVRLQTAAIHHPFQLNDDLDITVPHLETSGITPASTLLTFEPESCEPGSSVDQRQLNIDEDETLEQDEAHDQQGSKLKTGSTPSLSSSSPSSPSSPSSSKSTVGGASNADRTTGEKETGGGGGGGGIGDGSGRVDDTKSSSGSSGGNGDASYDRIGQGGSYSDGTTTAATAAAVATTTTSTTTTASAAENIRGDAATLHLPNDDDDNHNNNNVDFSDFRRKPCPLEDKKCPIHVTANASQGSSPSPEERSGTSRTTTNATSITTGNHIEQKIPGCDPLESNNPSTSPSSSSPSSPSSSSSPTVLPPVTSYPSTSLTTSHSSFPPLLLSPSLLTSSSSSSSSSSSPSSISTTTTTTAATIITATANMNTTTTTTSTNPHKILHQQPQQQQQNQRQPEIFVIGGEGEREEIRGSEDKERKAIQPVDVGFGQTCTNNERERNSSARTKDENDSSENQMISNNPPNGDNSPLNFKTQQKNKTFVIDPNDIDKCMKTFEKMIDQNLKTLASGAKEEPDDSRAYNELKEKLFGEDFEKQIDSFLNDI